MLLQKYIILIMKVPIRKIIQKKQFLVWELLILVRLIIKGHYDKFRYPNR